MSTAVMNETALDSLQELVARLQQDFSKLRERVAELEAENSSLKAERSRLLVGWAKDRYPKEELDRRAKEVGACSTAELLERLEKSCASR